MITTENISFFVLIMTTLAGVWWRVEAKISKAEDKADEVERSLARHKLHVAETYTTKQGMQEQTAQIMRAIEAIGDKMDRTNERLDRVVEQAGKAPRRTT